MASVRYIVDDIDKAVEFYRDLLGRQILLEDPSGNVVELFEYKK